MSMAYVLHDQVRNQSLANYVTGHDRPKYFKRPLVPQMTDTPVHLSQPPLQLKESVRINEIENSIEPRTKNAQIQTDYRESEAQTDPYTPKYVLREGESPQVLSLEHLKWGQGLPATIDELQSIELSREDIWFSNALPPISDEASFNLRRKLMEEQELRQWNKKEQEIKKQQNQKLFLLQNALIEREKQVVEQNAQRIEEIKIKKTEQKNRLIAKIQRRQIKVLRKMTKIKVSYQKENEQRDIIQDYANFSSRVYAGITREGLSLDKIANQFQVQPVALTTFQGMQELSSNIRQGEFETKANVKIIVQDIQKDYTRLEKQHQTDIKKAQESLAGEIKKQEKEITKKKNEKQMKLKDQLRPNTPTWIKKLEENTGEILIEPQKFEGVSKYREFANEQKSQDQREKAVLLLQRLIKGRAMQNIMYEGQEQRLALIDELLLVARIENLPDDQVEEILMQQHEEKVKNAIIQSLQGEVISETMDQLSKELLRIKQERKVAQMVQVAEKDRRLREIEEAGKRQAEETLRQREDVLYNELMRVHQSNVDTYLDWIMGNTLEQASTRQAMIMTNLRQEKMNGPLQKFQSQYNNSETLIKELVQSFLIPNVQRNKLQKKIEIQERRYNQAAKKSLQVTLTKASTKLKDDTSGDKSKQN